VIGVNGSVGDPAPVIKRLRQDGVQWATCAWVDLSGRPKGKLIAITRLAQAAAGGDLYTPRGLAWLGRSNPVEAEGYTVPDLERAVRLSCPSRSPTAGGRVPT
jgi:glutamine synthetase